MRECAHAAKCLLKGRQLVITYVISLPQLAGMVAQFIRKARLKIESLLPSALPARKSIGWLVDQIHKRAGVDMRTSELS